jgi:DNA-binding winged helix-turn-helix (wHTH) protein/Flp pilus assembly protein TadD
MDATMARGRRQVEFSGFRLDMASRQLFGPDGGELPVTARALDVLAYLIEHRGRMVGKDELLDAVWPHRVVEENNLPQAISALRRTFGVGAGERRFIVTIPGRGYRFVAPTSTQPFVERRHRGGADRGDDAYRLCIAGRDLIDAPSQARCKRAIGLFRQALDRDPRCARAWCGLATAWRALTITGDMDPADAFPLARTAVQRALALAPQLAEAHAVRGYILFWNDWDWAGAERVLRHAIELGAGSPDGHFAYANLLNNLGRFEQALEHARKARELDPVSPLFNTIEGACLAAAGRIADAQARITCALDIAPAFWIALLARASMTLACGEPEAAIDTLELAARLSSRNSRVLAILAAARVACGDHAGARQLRDELAALSESSYVPATSRAAISNALGDHGEALDLLELAFAQRDVRMTFLKTDARWNNLRGTPRFDALMHRLGFAGGEALGIL